MATVPPKKTVSFARPGASVIPTAARYCTAIGEGLTDSVEVHTPLTFTITARNLEGVAKKRGGDPFEVEAVRKSSNKDKNNNNNNSSTLASRSSSNHSTNSSNTPPPSPLPLNAATANPRVPSSPRITRSASNNSIVRLTTGPTHRASPARSLARSSPKKHSSTPTPPIPPSSASSSPSKKAVSITTTTTTTTTTSAISASTSSSPRSRSTSSSSKNTGGQSRARSGSGDGPLKIPLTDNDDGTYTAMWKFVVAGTYSISVTLNGTHVQGSPFLVSVFKYLDRDTAFTMEAMSAPPPPGPPALGRFIPATSITPTGSPVSLKRRPVAGVLNSAGTAYRGHTGAPAASDEFISVYAGNKADKQRSASVTIHDVPKGGIPSLDLGSDLSSDDDGDDIGGQRPNTMETPVVSLSGLGQVSQSTKTRVLATMHYIRQYYVEAMTYRWARNQRYEAVLESVRAQQDLSVYDQAAVLTDYFEKESAYLRKRRTRMRLHKDFQVLALIGRGGYGEVFLVRKTDTGEVMALKRMDKEFLMAKNQVEHIQTERKVMAVSRNAWLVSMMYSWQDSKYLYIAMEYLPGGDMRALLGALGFLDESAARFYIAQMFMAVETLHKLGYIHRDLKPDNFLVDRDGHLRLTDFGLSKGGVRTTHDRNSLYGHAVTKARPTSASKRASRSLRAAWRQRRRVDAYSLVGSPEYMAPEVLGGGGYDLTVDWWSLGCILYEMLVGYPPYTGSSPEEVFANVLAASDSLERPPAEDSTPGGSGYTGMSDVAYDLLSKLLAPNPAKRLGASSFNEIQSHPFFKNLDWKALKDIEPPFTPNLAHDADTSYFFDARDLDHAELDQVLGTNFANVVSEADSAPKQGPDDELTRIKSSSEHRKSWRKSLASLETPISNNSTSPRRNRPLSSSQVLLPPNEGGDDFTRAFAGFNFRRYGSAGRAGTSDKNRAALAAAANSAGGDPGSAAPPPLAEANVPTLF